MDHSRVKVFFYLTLAAFVIILARIIYLQHFDEDLKERSELNRVRTIVVEPSRGRIFDRNGTLLIDNQYAYNLYAIPEQFLKNESSFSFVTENLGIEKDTLLSMLTAPEVHADRFFRIMRDIDFSVYSSFTENRKELRGIYIKKEWSRKFIINSAPHLLGYLGEAKEAEELKTDISYGDLVGKKGIEFVYDSLLRGEKGMMMEIKDVKGNKISEYKKEEWKEAKRGKDIYLSLDLTLQQYIERLLSGKSGSVVVQNCKNGEILAMVSKPDYPVDLFNKKLSKEEWKKWSEDPAEPLYNKTIMGLYPPGSVIKMATILAATEQKLKSPSDKVNCPGGMQIGNRFIKCWNRQGGHGNVDMLSALYQSCDTYFYDIAIRINLDKWKNTLNRLGFGKKTGIDLRFERSGLVPDIKYYKKRITGDLDGRSANLMIGQGELLVTPLQIANYTSIIANGGIKFTPHLLHKYGNDGEFAYFDSTASDTIDLDPKILSVVRKGMYLVVNTWGGTAIRSKSSIISFAGKTGTAQNPHGDDHAWFTSYGPYDDPEITVTVFEEFGQHGSGAALIAKDIFEFWYNSKNKKAPAEEGPVKSDKP
ncbi:MAG TPA: penicillin-binding protein 2 [Clostridiales bacterium]|nr:penicillin-binding protein 2 [Clostridiales bacterium]HQP70130.1 penicillin-binding protein 2 [Clostridiales bacterium]